MIFKRHPNTSLYLELTQASSGFIAYYLVNILDESPNALTLEDDRDEAEQADSPNELTLEQTWKSCLGYYLFLKTKPDNLDAFAAVVSVPIAFLAQQHTGFLWLAYDNSSMSEIDCIETKTDDTDSDNPRVVVLDEVLLNFGGYKLPFGKNTSVVYENPEDPTGFVFLAPPNPPNVCPPGATVPTLSDGVHLTFEGERRGCFECLSFIGDYYSSKSTSWHVGLRYAVNINQKVAHQFYPVFDLRDGRRPLLKMCWDPTNHLDPDRTFLEFQGESKKLVSAGYGACNFRLKTPRHPKIIPTYFRTVTGEVVGFIPKKGSAKLVFELWTEYPDPRVLDDLESAGDWRGEIDPPVNSRYYLVPSGEFELVLIHVDENDDYAFEPITSLEEEVDRQAEIPSKFLCGLSGIESVEFTPQDEDADGVTIPGDSIAFFPRKPAYIPVFPIIRGPESAVPALNDLQLIQRNYLTAWTGFVRANDDGFAYFSQPEEAPLYTAEDNNSGDELISLFEPVAEGLLPASMQRSFPVATAAGAVPVSAAPEPGPAVFIKNLETQIIGPCRREEIRKFSASPAAVASEKVTAVTPQGFKATVSARKTVKAQKWTKLLLARKAETDEEPGFELSFSDLDSTLQAAFQSNQLFLVASYDTYFKNGFESIVEMGAWKFDLNPLKGGGSILDNILIFKFSPGKLIERIRDPRSWTNPTAFNTLDPVTLSRLASELTEFFDRKLKEKLSNPASARYYERLQAIIEDELWTGIIGVNVKVELGSLSPDLKLIAAGVDKDKLVAHHIVVETSTLEFVPGESIDPAECSLFGLIDYEVTTALKDQPIDFAVTRLLAHFLKGELADFSCKAKLTVKELFGEKVIPKAKEIEFIGIRERHQGRDAYSLVVDPEGGDGKVVGPVDPRGLRRAKLDSSVIDFVAIDKVEFEVTETDEFLSVIFSFWGTIGFKTLKDGALDLFSYNGLPYSGLTVTMDIPLVKDQRQQDEGQDAQSDAKPDLANRTFTIDLAGIALDATPAAGDPRENSLVKKFPMKLQKLYASQGGTDPTKDGYVPVKTDLDGTDLAKPLYAGKPFYGLDFTLNLGTLGEFAANAGITVGLLLAWSPKLPPKEGSPPENRVNVFLKFPGVSAAKTDLLSLQGVIKLGASEYALKAYPEKVKVTDKGKVNEKDVTSWVLMLNGMALRILGIGFPLGEKPNLHIFGPPPDQPQQEPETSLGWYAVYKSGRNS